MYFGSNMASFKAKLFLFITVTSILFGATRAEASGGEAKEGEASAAKVIPKEQKEFYEKSQRLTTLSTRIEEAEKTFNGLVHHKATEKNPAEIQNILKQMNEVTAERNKNAEEYNKVKSELALRYPNQGESLNRQYQTQSKKSVEEMEGAAGLDELLTRTKKVVERKYAPFADPNEVPSHSKSQAAKPHEEQKKRLKLEK